MPEDEAISVLVPFHLRHVIAFGKSKQSDLSGDGEVDSKVVLDYTIGLNWDFPNAVAYCSNAFMDFKKRMDEGNLSLDRMATVEMLELLPGAMLGRQIVAPNGLLAQEVILPKKTYETMISEAAYEPVAFLLAREIGRICLENRHFDLQPQAFRQWAVQVLVGQASPPKKRPERWGKFPRNHLVISLTKQLVAKGMTMTRNEASGATSAFDAIAEGALAARVQGLSSYETVKGIFYRITR